MIATPKNAIRRRDVPIIITAEKGYKYILAHKPRGAREVSQCEGVAR